MESIHTDSSMLLARCFGDVFLLNRTNTLRFTVFEIGDNTN